MHSDNSFFFSFFFNPSFWGLMDLEIPLLHAEQESWNRESVFAPWFTSCISKLGSHFTNRLRHNLLVRFWHGEKKNCSCKRARKGLGGSSRKLSDRFLSSHSTFAVRCAVDAAHPPVKVLLADGLHQGRVRPVEQVLLIHGFAPVPLLHLLSLPSMRNNTKTHRRPEASHCTPMFVFREK